MKRKSYLTHIVLVAFVIIGVFRPIYTNAESNPLAEPVVTLKQFLDYKSMLDNETKEYKSFLQTYSIFGGLAVVAFGTILGWMNWKTRSDVRLEVQKQLETTVRQQVERQATRIDNEIRDAVNEIRIKMTSIEGEIRVKADQSRNTLEEVAFNFNKRLDEVINDIDKRRTSIDRILVELSSMSLRLSQGRTDLEPEQIIIHEENIKDLKILWVDDIPANNEFPANTLKSLGAKIDIALNTDEAFKKLQTKPNSFNLIISDMGRGANYKAGLEMLEAFRSANIETPIIFYSSARSVQKYGQRVKSLGARAIVAGSSSLFREIIEFVAQM
jgi:CheY-like chemotaxis protein